MFDRLQVATAKAHSRTYELCKNRSSATPLLVPVSQQGREFYPNLLELLQLVSLMKRLDSVGWPLKN